MKKQRDFKKAWIMLAIFTAITVLRTLLAFIRGDYFYEDFIAMYTLEGLIVMVTVYYFVRTKEAN